MTNSRLINKVLLIIAVVCVVVVGYFVFSRDTILTPTVTLRDIINKATISRKPIVFFIYPDDNKDIWDTVPYSEEPFAGTLTYSEPMSFFDQTKWHGQLGEMTEPALLAVDYRGRTIVLHQGIPSKDKIDEIARTVQGHHETMVAQDVAAKIEFTQIKSIYEQQDYINAMDSLRTFLAVYENTEYEQQARDLLRECSIKPQVIDYLRSNRDVSNRKVLLHKAKEDFRYKRYLNAQQAIGLLMNNFPGTEEAQEAAEIKEKMDAIAREGYQEANELYKQKKYFEAYEKFLSLHEKFRSTHWDLYITGRIKQIEADPEFQKYQKNLELTREAKGVFEHAEKLFEKEQWDQAEQYYNMVLRFYPESRYAFRSQQRLDEMNTLRYSQPTPEPDNNAGAAKEE